MEVSNQQIWGQDVYDRIMKKTDKSGDCWVWTGGRNSKGYGRVRIGKKLYSPHKVIKEIELGKFIDKDLQVCHHCDNPPCCNPEHLFVGTRSENMLDCSKKNRISRLGSVKGKINYGLRKLTKEDIINILKYLNIGYTQRELGKMFNVCHRTIFDIKRGKVYAEITGIKYKGELPI